MGCQISQIEPVQRGVSTSPSVITLDSSKRNTFILIFIYFFLFFAEGKVTRWWWMEQPA